jgi:hypothetical protein
LEQVSLAPWQDDGVNATVSTNAAVALSLHVAKVQRRITAALHTPQVDPVSSGAMAAKEREKVPGQQGERTAEVEHGTGTGGDPAQGPEGPSGTRLNIVT